MSEITVIRDQLNRIDASITKVEAAVNEMRVKGCAKSEQHARIESSQNELFRRVRTVELAQAEGKGKVAIVMILVGVAVTVLINWLTKLLTHGASPAN